MQAFLASQAAEMMISIVINSQNEIGEVAHEFISLQTAFLSVLNEGEAALAVFRDARQELTERTAALRERVSRRKRGKYT